jgi:hypothetical protein
MWCLARPHNCALDARKRIEKVTANVASCPSCLQEISNSDRFCMRCGAPLAFPSTLDPVGSIRTEAELFRRALRRPSTLVMSGALVLLLPLVILYVGVVVLALRRTIEDPSAGAVIGVVILVGAAALPTAILVRVAYAYLCHKWHSGAKVL